MSNKLWCCQLFGFGLHSMIGYLQIHRMDSAPAFVRLVLNESGNVHMRGTALIGVILVQSLPRNKGRLEERKGLGSRRQTCIIWVSVTGKHPLDLFLRSRVIKA